MSKFLTALVIANCVADEGLWELQSPLVYESDILGCTVTVPKGFFTDLASVPRVPFVFEAWGNRAHMSAVVHDYLYRIDSIPVTGFMQANRVFREAMKVRKQPWYIRHCMFTGVCFGWGSYHRKRVDWKMGDPLKPVCIDSNTTIQP